MIRELLTPRPDWRERMEDVGFHYHSIDGVYWDESRCYRLAVAEVDELEAATVELHARCLDAVRHVIDRGRFADFDIPAQIVPLIEQSFADFEQGRVGGFTLLGRMDLRYGTGEAPKLLEYNADTPTAILEASVAQWSWLEALRPEADQFNSLHEKLVAAWTRLRAGSSAAILHFTSASDEESAEDFGNVQYLRDTALQAGWRTQFLAVDEIGHDGIGFQDAAARPIELLFKLYPWEWLAGERFAAFLPGARLQLIEPAWKMLLSNKAILVILWELFPGHPNLLPASFERGGVGDRYARKPRLGREGANVLLVDGARREEAPGAYDAGRCIYQELAPLPRFGEDHLLVGSWVVGGESAGIGLREDSSAITRDTSRFVPHYF